MIHKQMITATILSALALGCPGDGKNVTPGRREDSTLGWAYTRSHLPIEAGSYDQVNIRCYPEFMGDSTPYARLIHEGPGELYRYWAAGDGTPGKLIPWDEIKEGYRGNGVWLHYRPPFNEDVPPGGMDVLFACEVLSPFSGKWERSPDYVRRIVRRDRPADYYIQHIGFPIWPEYQPESVTLAAGAVYEFYFNSDWTLTFEDIRLRASLLAPEGYLGDTGNINITVHFNSQNPPMPVSLYSCVYAAPEDVAEPVDIVACLTYYDHWVREWIDHKFTIKLAPREQQPGQRNN